jgi:hypothetical protein
MSEFFDSENGFGDCRIGDPIKDPKRNEAFARLALQEASVWDEIADKYRRQMDFAARKAEQARSDAMRYLVNLR